MLTGVILIEEINIIFYFDKYLATELLPEGKATLEKLASKIMDNYTSTGQIDLIGHTDHLGSEKYNYALGANRAQTVKDYLLNQGVNIPINISSAGETQSITNNCGYFYTTKALKMCLQPAQRVVIKILGIKNKKVKK